jgi:hypothetical protein
MLRPSMPGSARTARAASLFLFFAVTGALIRLSRRDFGLLPVLAPLDFHGTSTNFIVCAGTPFLAFCFKDVIGFSSYMKTAMGVAVGLSLYEVVQIYLPRRTFDAYDIVASFMGAIFSMLLASILFLMHRQHEQTNEQDAAANGGAATQRDSSDLAEGPQSVS